MAKLAKKPAQKRQAKSKPRTGRPASQRAAIEASGSTAEPGSTTKGGRLIALLRSPPGATITAMMQETGWQAHSVRGFLAGVVRKKLKLALQSSKLDGQRVYCIEANASSNAPALSSTRQAG